VTPTSGLVTTEAGGTATFTVVLNTVPTADVFIGLSSSNPSEGRPSVTYLAFTPANALIPQTVTVTGVPDNRADGDVAYTILTMPAVSTDLRYSGVNPPDVAVTNRDDGTSPPSPPPPAGTPAPGTAGVTDVTALVRISRSRLRAGPQTGRVRQTIRLTNVGGAPIRGPVSLVVVNPGRGVRLVQRTGVTTIQRPGSPYLDVAALGGDDLLSPGESASVLLEFRVPAGRRLKYALRVLAGVGAR
jgi:hypothetical protein